MSDSSGTASKKFASMLRWYQGTGGVGAHVGIAVRGALGPIDDEQLFERETQAAC